MPSPLPITLAAISLAALFPSVAVAKSLTLTPQQVAQHAARHNPALAAARLRIEEARGRLHNAGRLPNPEVEGGFMKSPNMPEHSIELGVVQRFPLTGRLRFERAVSRAELKAAEAEVDDVARKIAGDAKLQAVRILASQEQQALRQRQIENSKQLADFSRSRAAAGEIPLTDASQVELETRQLESEIIQLRVEEAGLNGMLRPMLGLKGGDTVRITGKLEAGTTAGSGADRPDLRAARANIEAAQQAAALAHAQRFEDVGFGIGAEYERTMDMPEGYSNDRMLGFRFSIPLPIWNDNSGKIREAKAAAERRRLESVALQNDISGEIHGILAERAELLRLLATIDRDLLPSATQLEEELQQSQAAGQTPLVEVLRARDRRLQIARQRLDVLRDLHLASVRHEIATGRIIHTTTVRKGK
ncbi:MAG: TolC family protein [Chthoniobacteraceae bacterium]